MQTKVFNLRHKPSGVLTDATSVTFANPPEDLPRYGVRRISTGDIVVEHNVPWTKTATGQYTHTLEGLVDGAQYDYWVEVVYNGGTKRINQTFTTPTGDAYNTQADMETVRGTTNIQKWSKKSGAAGYDVPAIEFAIQNARNQINLRLGNRFQLPLVADADGTPLSSATREILRMWGEKLSSYELYISRGLDTEDDPTGNVLKTDRDEALAEIGKVVDGSLAFDAYSVTTWHTPRAEVVSPLTRNLNGRYSWPEN